MRIVGPVERAERLLSQLGQASKLQVTGVHDRDRFEIAVATSKPNVGRVEISATADLYDPGWHSLIDFQERH